MLDWYEIVIRLGSAALVGGLIGLNRDLHHKPSGLRTLSLVGLGAAPVVLVVADGTTDPNATSRILQGIITGVGFLGAGVIIHEAATAKVRGLRRPSSNGPMSSSCDSVPASRALMVRNT